MAISLDFLPRCRAQAAAEKAGSGADNSSAAAGTLVCVHVAAVPQDAAERLVQRVAALQVSAFILALSRDLRKCTRTLVRGWWLTEGLLTNGL